MLAKQKTSLIDLLNVKDQRAEKALEGKVDLRFEANLIPLRQFKRLFFLTMDCPVEAMDRLDPPMPGCDWMHPSHAPSIVTSLWSLKQQMTQEMGHANP